MQLTGFLPPWVSESVYLQLLEFFIVFAAGALITRFVLVPAISRVAKSRSDSKKITHQTRNLTAMVGIFSSFVIALQAGQFGSLVTILGTIAAALTVAIGFGMREMVANLVAGVFIHMDNPFVKGDYVKIGETEGEVRQINFRSTVLNGHDSEKVEVPNGQVATMPTRNYTKGNRTKNSAEIKVGPEHVEKASELLLESAKNNQRVLDKPDPNVRVLGFDDGKSRIELHYWTRDSDDLRIIRSDVLKDFSGKAASTGIFAKEEE